MSHVKKAIPDTLDPRMLIIDRSAFKKHLEATFVVI